MNTNKRIYAAVNDDGWMVGDEFLIMSNDRKYVEKQIRSVFRYRRKNDRPRVVILRRVSR